MKLILIAVFGLMAVLAGGSFVVAQHTDNSSDSKVYFDPVLNGYYDSNGVLLGVQNDGYDINYFSNNPPVVAEDGSSD